MSYVIRQMSFVYHNNNNTNHIHTTTTTTTTEYTNISEITTTTTIIIIITTTTSTTTTTTTVLWVPQLADASETKTRAMVVQLGSSNRSWTRPRQAQRATIRPVFKSSIWKNGPIPWEVWTFRYQFEVQISNGSGIWDPQLEMYQFELFVWGF